MGRRCLPFTFPSNVFNFARPAYCRRNKSKSLSALRDPGLFLFCAPPLAAASWARKKRRIPDAEKVVSFFSCFLRNSPLASHLVPPESLANPHFSHFLPSHPALSRISQLSCLFTSTLQDCIDAAGFGEALLEQRGYRLNAAETTYIRRNDREFQHLRTQPKQGWDMTMK